MVPRGSFARPQPAAMGIDDRPADRQPHPHSAGLRGVESLENALEMFRIDARPRIAHCYKDTSVWRCSVLINSSRVPHLNRAHCFDRVQDQVQDHLLQLNAIAVNGKESLRKPGSDRDAILGDCASRQYARYPRSASMSAAIKWIDMGR